MPAAVRAELAALKDASSQVEDAENYPNLAKWVRDRGRYTFFEGTRYNEYEVSYGGVYLLGSDVLDLICIPPHY
jgi:hypothetical protein